ncbi:MAG: hypothetical protein RI101_06755 [Nitrospira sp.]|jgi:hypothetical protein|nr:hypothetical protein [Nitrospira sp.]
MTLAHLLPLEACLKEVSASSRNEFPTPQIDYFQRYRSVKEWLINNVYKHIGATLATDGGIYTDHGPDHFDQVIVYAGLMIGAEEPKCVPDRLKPYEVYVLLMAILLHDAGNVYGRIGHEKKAFKLLSEMGALAGDDNVQKKDIADVAQAHGGETPTGDKDTIGILKEHSRHATASFRAQVLAALLRFADEVCENRGRGARVLLDGGAISKKSEVYHAYAESVTTAWPDRGAKTIDIKYDIPINRATRLWGKGDGETYLIDEILLRLEKMDLERKYCTRFMFPVFRVDRIDVTININGEDMTPIQTHPIRLEESGYPSSPENLAKRYPHLLGQTLHKCLQTKI